MVERDFFFTSCLYLCFTHSPNVDIIFSSEINRLSNSGELSHYLSLNDTTPGAACYGDTICGRGVYCKFKLIG